MDLKSQQTEFDNKKWYDSVLSGDDRCGSYDFCVKCNKEDEYPCAKAMQRFQKKYIRLAIIRRHK